MIALLIDVFGRGINWRRAREIGGGRKCLNDFRDAAFDESMGRRRRLCIDSREIWCCSG